MKKITRLVLFTFLAILIFNVEPLNAAEEETATPSLTSDCSEWAIGRVYQYESVAKTIHLQGKNLTGDVTISLPYSDNWDYMLYDTDNWNSDEYTISADKMCAEGGYDLHLEFYPTEECEGNDEIVIKAEGCVDIVIPVSWKAVTKPTISVSPYSMHLGELGINSTNVQTISVTGSGLTGDITISNPTHSDVTISQNTITHNEDGTCSASIELTINPTTLGKASDKLTFSSPEAEDVNLDISWDAITTVFEVDEKTIDFGTVKTGMGVTKTIVLNAKGISGDVSITEPTTGSITVNATDIPKYNADGFNIRITCEPTDLETTSDSISISTEGFDPIVVKLNWQPAQGDVTSIVGTPDDYGTSVPLNTYYCNNKFETIYRSSDIECESGILTGIAYPYCFVSTTDTKHFTVWVANTTDSEVGNTFTNVNDLKKVFEGDRTLESGGDPGSLNSAMWLTLPFESNFEYNGGNLRVVVEATSDDYSMGCWYFDTKMQSQKFLIKKDDDSESFLTAEPEIVSNFVVTKFFSAPAGPNISVDETLWNAGDINVGESVSKVFKVTGTNLTDNITISNSNNAVQVSTNLISKDEVAEGYEITVTISPVNVTDANDQIVITSSDVSQIISVNWNAIQSSNIENICFDVPTQVSVYDIQGHCIMNSVVNGSLKNEIGNLTSGLYLIKVNEKVLKVYVK